ncbi:hypothetical protein D3C77_598940 [compost metagenome]
MSTDPADDAAGTTALNSFEFRNVAATSVLPNWALAPLTKLLPLISIILLPVTKPELGLRLEMVGAGNTSST